MVARRAFLMSYICATISNPACLVGLINASPELGTYYLIKYFLLEK